MLTQRSRYALRALLILARTDRSMPLPLSRLSRDANVPRKFLEIIFGDLKQAGLITAQRGKTGGYALARPPHLISFGDIIRVIEGPLALVPCVSRTAYRRCADCVDEGTCAIRRAMLVIRDDTARILDGTSLADSIAEDLAAA